MIGTEESAGKMPTGPTAKMAVLQLRARRARPPCIWTLGLLRQAVYSGELGRYHLYVYDRVGENYLPR
jgi:hypothetical protein